MNDEPRAPKKAALSRQPVTGCWRERERERDRERERERERESTRNTTNNNKAAMTSLQDDVKVNSTRSFTGPGEKLLFPLFWVSQCLHNMHACLTHWPPCMCLHAWCGDAPPAPPPPHPPTHTHTHTQAHYAMQWLTIKAQQECEDEIKHGCCKLFEQRALISNS